MKVLFIQLRFESNTAVMCLSSFLKSKGHQTDVLIIEGEDNYIQKVKEEIKPSIIAFPATTVDIKKLLEVNKKLKRSFLFFSVFGGPHPTFFPELIKENSLIDAICIGEGEYALLELADRLEKNQRTDDICNLYLYREGKIIKNSIRPLIEDLDSLPFLDKDIYSKYYSNSYLRKNVPIRFLSSRGCPYKCTYCFNHKFFELYSVSGKRIRRRSVDSLIQEIKEVIEKFDIPMVSFQDDIFCFSKKWMIEFADKYKEEIGLPYSINTRPNTIDDEMASLLKKSGCYYVTFSIETGDNFLRNEVLNRNMSDLEIKNSADSLHNYKIPFCTGNMLGVPGETMDTLMKTIEINRKCKPHYAWASIFQPFPKLNLTCYAIEKGYFDGDFGKIGNDQFIESPLRLERKEEIVRFHKLFALMVRYPYITPLVRILIKFPLNNSFNWIFEKYKTRLNNAVISANKKMMEKQCSESFISVMAYFLKDLLEYSRIGGRKNLNYCGLKPAKGSFTGSA